jgi:SAM-dependent methyltransferase
MDKQKVRDTSFGQSGKLTIVDVLGRYLSEREIAKTLKRLVKGNTVMLDIGCGYDAWMLQKFYPLLSSGVAVDIAVSEKIKSLDNITVFEQPIELALPNLNSDYFNVILMNSVLEHLEDPFFVLKECVRLMRKGGVLIINVPTWAGKKFLEQSAFKFKFSPALEMDDHKMYYDQRDLWPILVKAGFKPSLIKMKYHKFGLNLFSTCTKA